MHVCFASTFYPRLHRNWGGAEVACQRLRNLLLEDGHRVTLLTSRPDNGRAAERDWRALRTWADFMGRRGAMALDEALPFDPWAYVSARRLLDEIRPDVLHLHSFKELTFSLLAAAKRRGLPVLFSLYDLWALCPQSNLLHRRGGTCTRYMGLHCLWCVVPARKPLVFLRRTFFRRFLPQMDGLIVLSDGVRDHLARFGVPKEKIHVCPLPLFEGLSRPVAVRPRGRTILFVGWMTRPKGLHVLIEAMPRVLARFPDARVRVVETGAKAQHKAAFLRRIGELGLEGRFEFLGKKSPQDIRRLLTETAAVAVPEQWPIAWPIFCTEAMAYARPIAASRIGDIPWFIRDGETGRLFDPCSPRELADCLIGFFEDPAAAEAMGRRAQEFIFDICEPKGIVSRLMNCYEEARNGAQRKV